MTGKPNFTDRYIDLAQPRLGAEVIAASDEFFAPKERLIQPEAPVFMPDKYDDHGKWMDGWESRRRRDGGHDQCVIRLCTGVIHGVELDTRFFTGNYPPQASIEGCSYEADPDDQTEWFSLVARVGLQGDAQHFFTVNEPRVCTHVRLNIYPDGGVARLRIYGVAHYDWAAESPTELLDLAAMTRGGRALACNDMHYGHMSNLIAPGHAVNMGDGWETRRRRTPGNDWVILKLGHPGTVCRVEVDTAFFKGNYPARCSLHGALLQDRPDSEVTAGASYWREILPPAPLGPDQMHVFEREVADAQPVSHVRFDIYPDGGVSRLRLFGHLHER